MQIQRFKIDQNIWPAICFSLLVGLVLFFIGYTIFYPNQPAVFLSRDDNQSHTEVNITDAQFNNCHYEDQQLIVDGDSPSVKFPLTEDIKNIKIMYQNTVVEGYSLNVTFHKGEAITQLPLISYFNLENYLPYDVTGRYFDSVTININPLNTPTKLLCYDQSIDLDYQSINTSPKWLFVLIFLDILFILVLFLVAYKYDIGARAWTYLKLNWKKWIKWIFVFIALTMIFSLSFYLVFEKFICVDKSASWPFRLAVCFASLSVMIISIIRNYKLKNIPAENYFLNISFFCGVMFICMSPFWANSLDFDSHYVWNCRMSNIGGYLTQADAAISQIFPDFFNLSNAIKYDELANYYNHIGYGFSKWTGFHLEISEFPSACMMAVCRYLYISFSAQLMLMKFTNLICYVFISYFAIKKLKSGKMILSIILLFPTCLFQATSISYDWWVVSLMAFGFATFFAEQQQKDKPYSFLQSILMFGTIGLACLPKQVYLPLLLIPLLLNKNTFRQYKKQRVLHIFVCVIVVLIIALSLLIRTSDTVTVGGDLRGGNVNMIEQILFILHNPIDFCKMFIKYASNYLSLANTENYVNFYSYSKVPIGCCYILIVLFAAVFTDKNVFDKHTHNWYTRFIIFVICFGVAMLLLLAFYLTFTPVGENTINGCQPRYLLPLIYPVLAVAGSCRIKNNIPQNLYKTVIFSAIGFFIVFGVFQVLVVKFV